MERLVGGIANTVERTNTAFGLSSNTNLPAEVDNLMCEQDPLCAVDDLHEILLYLDRFGVFGEIETPRNALYMCIDHNARGNPESSAEDNIGGFAGSSGNKQHLVHCARHFALIVGQYLLCCANNGFRFVIKETS